jgi:hypothetical protein
MAFLRSVAVLALVSLASVGVSAFAPTHVPFRSSTALQALKNHDNHSLGRQAATTFVAAAYLIANVAAAAPVFALGDDFSGSSQVIAGRSGGRAGGRSMSRPASRTSYSSTTIIRPGPTVVVPAYGGGYGGYGYNPYGGLGLGLGLNAVSGIGEGIREYRQEGEIRESRTKLEEARIKQAELEARLKQLEMAQQK